MAVKKIENKDLMDCAGKNVDFLQCNIPKPMSDFYDSWSPYNITNIKKLNRKTNKQEFVHKTKFCKECLGKIYSKYKEETNSSEFALFLTCMQANIPFIAEKVESTFAYVTSEAKRGAKVSNIFGTYYNILARETSKHHLWQDFSCTDIDYKDIATHIEKRDITKKEMERFELDWGKQDDTEDYEFLEYRYDVYTSGKEITPAQETLYRQLCLVELAKRRKEVIKDSTKEEQEMILKLMDKLKISNFNEQKDKSEIDRILEKQIWEIENTEPCELVDKEEYKDFLDINKNWGKHILRAVKNLVAGTKDYPDVTRDEWD